MLADMDDDDSDDGHSRSLQVVGGLLNDYEYISPPVYDLMNNGYYDLLWCADPCYNYRYPIMVRCLSPRTIVSAIHYPSMAEMLVELRQIRYLASNEE